jgi:hypothetical protein
MYLPEDNAQMFDILTDLRTYAAQNGLHGLAEKLDDALHWFRPPPSAGLLPARAAGEHDPAAFASIPCPPRRPPGRKRRLTSERKHADAGDSWRIFPLPSPPREA